MGVRQGVTCDNNDDDNERCKGEAWAWSSKGQRHKLMRVVKDDGMGVCRGGGRGEESSDRKRRDE